MANVIIGKTEQLKGDVCAPPSKSYTQRMLIAASLSPGLSRISGPLYSADTDATVRAILALGTKLDVTKGCWAVTGSQSMTGATAPIDVGDSGATLRFIIPVAALATGNSVFVLGGSLKQRPIEPLLASLKDLGVKTSTSKTGSRSYIKVHGGGIPGGQTSIRGDLSSQFISGLMFACAKAQRDTEITLTTELESKGYVEMTREVLIKHGLNISISEDFRRVKIPGNQAYNPHDHRVPGDFSSAAFLLASAAVTHSKVTVENLDYSLVQADKAIIHILQQMGVQGKVCKNEIKISGTNELLKPIDANVKHTPDLAPVLAVLGCYASGTSLISGAKRLRLKESDRLSSLYLELTKMGAYVTETEDGLVIRGPCKLRGAEIDPHNDHRIAMACAVAALGAEGKTVIREAESVKKSYPTFFIDLQRLGADVVGGKFDR